MTSTVQYWSLGDSVVTLSYDNDLWSLGDLYDPILYDPIVITKGRLVISLVGGTAILRRSINPNKPITILA
jgi:hypothetical protein